MARTSYLTQGLEPLCSKSKDIRRKLDDLYARDDELQVAHQQAQRDDELGEEVVTKYKAFIFCRQLLIVELKKHKVQVPWQLSLTIDDLELTLKQRREKKETTSLQSTNHLEENKKPFKQCQSQSVLKAQSERVMVAFAGPTLIALVISMLWYHHNV